MGPRCLSWRLVDAPLGGVDGQGQVGRGSGERPRGVPGKWPGWQALQGGFLEPVNLALPGSTLGPSAPSTVPTLSSSFQPTRPSSSELLHPCNYAWPYFPRRMWRSSLTKDPWAVSRCQRQPGRCSLDVQVFKAWGMFMVFWGEDYYFYCINKSKKAILGNVCWSHATPNHLELIGRPRLATS